MKINDQIRKNNLKMKGYAEEDYYFDKVGILVLTAKYHEKRGYCCKKLCKHCPWQHKYEVV